jgi:hypothetical protein
VCTGIIVVILTNAVLPIAVQNGQTVAHPIIVAVLPIAVANPGE